MTLYLSRVFLFVVVFVRSVMGDFPIGIFSPGSTNHFGILRSAGFDLVTGPALASYLDLAQSNGLRVLASPPGNGGQVLTIDRHPALWAWLLEDEPEMVGTSPVSLQKAHAALRSQGVEKPTFLILYRGYEALDYANIADITACDRYPIGWMPLCTFGQHLRMTRLALGKGKPLVAIIQAFDWGTVPGQMPFEDPAQFRPPTHAEIRCMTYLALINQAAGLFYYCFDAGPGGWRMPQHPDTWSALTRTVQEVRTRQPLFQAKQLWWPKQQRWADPSNRFNQSLEGSIDSVLLRVEKGNVSLPAGDYLLAVNNTAKTITWSVTLPDLKAQSIPVHGESRRIPVKDGWITETLPPYGVLVARSAER